MSTPLANTLDLRQTALPQRSSLLFSHCAALLPGQTLQLINDHDPEPLNVQFQLRSPGLFNWTYLEQGPQQWRVEIGKSAAAASNAAPGSCCSGGACCG